MVNLNVALANKQQFPKLLEAFGTDPLVANGFQIILSAAE
jgi:hypothetical protein